MKRGILFGSIIAVVILILASFPSVVGIQSVKRPYDSPMNKIQNRNINSNDLPCFDLGVLWDLLFTLMYFFLMFLLLIYPMR